MVIKKKKYISSLLVIFVIQKQQSAICFENVLHIIWPAAQNELWSNFLFKYHSRDTERLLTHTGPLSERHEGAEDAVNVLGAVLDREASLQL